MTASKPPRSPVEHERIREYLTERLRRECAGGNQAKVGRQIGKKRQSVNPIVKGRRRMPDEWFDVLLKRYGHPAEGERRGEMRRPRQRPRESEPPQLAEAIGIRTKRWSIATVEQLRGVARRTGVRLTVGTWIDAGDELEAQGLIEDDEEEITDVRRFS